MTIKINFEYFDTDLNESCIKTVEANLNDTLLDVAHNNELPLEGACGGSLACSTCHVILEDQYYNEDDLSDEEDAFLDVAPGRTDTSRLGCQILVDKSHENMTIKIPKENRNLS